MSELSPLSGVKLKSEFGAVRAAFDPTRTWAAFHVAVAKVVSGSMQARFLGVEPNLAFAVPINRERVYDSLNTEAREEDP
jgi:hypothetical protein